MKEKIKMYEMTIRYFVKCSKRQMKRELPCRKSLQCKLYIEIDWIFRNLNTNEKLFLKEQTSKWAKETYECGSLSFETFK